MRAASCRWTICSTSGCAAASCSITWPTVYEDYTGKIALENLRPSWLVFSTGFRKTWLLVAAKRVFDIVAAIIGLILSVPLTLLTMLIVKLESPGDPVLYHQERVGLNGAPFTIHKFRTMRSDAEATSGPVWSGANDSRITSVGTFLRKTRLDEIPQLWNVLRGDMSLIGPRPERPAFVAQLTQQIPVLRSAPRRQARADRLGAGTLQPTAPASKTRSRRCSTTSTTSSTCRWRSTW